MLVGRSKGAALAMLVCGTAFGEVNRVVIIKVDGLPERLVERYAAESADGGRVRGRRCGIYCGNGIDGGSAWK